MPDSYPRVPSGEELQAYFENYARDFNIFDKIRFNTAISGLEQQADGRWIVHFTDTKTGVSDQKAFDFVVVATGIYFDPFIPRISGTGKI